mmetsp:Transcript_12502/g.26980  ORF Transcript_12502/g.26980 Transcript_12502/m.26980 type:complete len:612 (-) Transcript_12502:26-1861(-)
MATTSRILTGLNRRQIHQHHHSVQYYASQLDYYAQSFQTKRPLSSSSSSSGGALSVTSAVTSSQLQLRHQRRDLFPRYQNQQKWQQYQQQRYLSDHLKQRAIDALKSKNNKSKVTATNASVTADNDNASNVLLTTKDDKIQKGRSGADGVVKSDNSDPDSSSNNGGSSSSSSMDSKNVVEQKQSNIQTTATAETETIKSDTAEKVPEINTAKTEPIITATNDASAVNADTVSSSDDATKDDDNTNADNDASSPIWAPNVHLHEFAPKIVVVGVGGAGTNAVNNMVASGLAGVEFLALNTDAQHLSTSLSPTRLQIGTHLTSGLGCGANPDAGRLAAEESSDAIQSCIEDAHMVFITAGMGGGTGTGAAPVVAGLCYDLGILTVSVVTTPFRFEGTHRRRLALEGVDRLKEVSDTLICVPNQNLFRLVGEKTSFVDSFRLADNVLLAGVRSITDLMTSPGLINLDFADVQSVMHGMGNALLGTGQACHDDAVGSYGIGEVKKEGGIIGDTNEEQSAEGNPEDECRAIRAAKMALNNPLLGEGNMDIGSAKGMLVNMSGGSDMTLYEVDRAAEYITERVVDPDANIIFGSAYDSNLTGCVRVSVVATGIEEEA